MRGVGKAVARIDPVRAAARERCAGFTMLELVVAMAIFAVFLAALLELQREAISFDRTIRFEWMRNSYPTAVAARLRKDVQEASSYPASFLHFRQSPQMLLLRRSADTPVRTIIYEFDATSARRREYSGEDPTSYWETRDTPHFFIDAAEGSNGETGVALRGFDRQNRLVVEGSFFPRAR